ncbi:DsbA family protein [Marinicaulis aureus]|uniref:DsbA family protein n=1 Tax=Hyphococcus aureus TaxID=2666033 RepID=A0ABW1L3P5_9PROT
MQKNTKTAIGAALAGSFLLGALVVGYSAAQQKEAAPKASHAQVSTSFSELQEEEIGEIVRAYLMENPEVIIEAVNAYSVEQRMAEVERAKTAARENISLLLDPATSHVAGKKPESAKVAVIELYDYHCGYCKTAAGLVKDVVKKDADVKIVFRELPILREESAYAAEMALAARDNDKFLDFHFDMLGSSGVLTKERVDGLARKHGLDVKKMNAEIDSGSIPDMIEANHLLAQEMGVDGTPAFIVASTNGAFVDVMVGWSEENLRAMINEAKKAG